MSGVVMNAVNGFGASGAGKNRMKEIVNRE
jgi:hypothetical protein